MNPYVAQHVCRERTKKAISEGAVLALTGLGTAGLIGAGLAADYYLGKADARNDLQAGAKPNQSRGRYSDMETGLLSTFGYDRERRRLMDNASEGASVAASKTPPPPM